MMYRRLLKSRNFAVSDLAASGTWVMGMNYSNVPAGATQINKGGARYCLNGNTWFKPSYGANGVFYTVVRTR